MAPDDKNAQVNNLLNQKAAAEVRAAHLDSVSPTTADIEAVSLSFEGEAVRFASEWLTANPSDATNTKPFAFVLSRSIDTDLDIFVQAGVTGHERFQAFRSQKLINLSGCVIVATINLENAVVLPVASVTNSQQLFGAITNCRLQDRHIVVFEPPKANLILLRRGLDGGSRTHSVLPAGTRLPWKLSELEAQIQQFHEDYTRVPLAALLPWKSATKGVTIEKLELRISQTLAGFLDQQWRRRGSVLAEYPSNAGRIDIFVTEPVLEKGSGPCVIEVKVLRGQSTSEPTRNMHKTHAVRWAKKGLAQADLYRQDYSAPSAYLYSFDARDKDIAMPEIDALANKMKIEHRKHFMYRSTDNLQDAVLAKAEADI